MLQLNIDAACATVDDICRRTFLLDASPSARVFRPDSPLVVRTDDVGSLTGLVVKIDADNDGIFETTVTNYVKEPANALSKSWPVNRLVAVDHYWPVSNRQSVEVTARWGWPSTPKPVQSATAILAGRLFKRADSLLGVMGVGDLGAIMLRAVDPDVQRMLAPYVRPAIL
jgi:hypothetical protein